MKILKFILDAWCGSLRQFWSKMSCGADWRCIYKDGQKSRRQSWEQANALADVFGGRVVFDPERPISNKL